MMIESICFCACIIKWGGVENAIFWYIKETKRERGGIK